LKSRQGFGNWYVIDLRFESGVSGRIDVLPTAGVIEETYELLGENFRAIVTCPVGPWRGWRCFRENRIVIQESAENLPEDVLNGCYDEAAAFIGALSQKADPRPSIADVFPSVQLCMQMASTTVVNVPNAVSLKT
jgi:hypothetical protein